MHIIVLMVAIFFNPGPDGKTREPEVRSVIAPDTMACMMGATAVSNTLLQNPTVHSVKAACFKVDGTAPTDKAS